MIHLNSEQVKVFPCSYRGYKEGTERIPFDAESRMLTEHNFLHSGNIINLFGNNDDAAANTFIIKAEYNNIEILGEITSTTIDLECVLDGYYFKINALPVSLDAEPISTNCYIGIALRPITIISGTEQTSQTTNVIAAINIDQGTALISGNTQDLYLDYEDNTGATPVYKFAGLVFANAAEKVANSSLVWLKVMNIVEDPDTHNYIRYININDMMNKVKINEAQGEIVMTNKPQTIVSAKTFTSTAPLTIHTEQVLNSNITNATVTNANVTNATITNANITTATITNANVATATVTGSFEVKNGTNNILKADSLGVTIPNATIGTATITTATITNLNAIDNVILASGKKVTRNNKEVTVPDYASKNDGCVLVLKTVNNEKVMDWVDAWDGGYSYASQ